MVKLEHISIAYQNNLILEDVNLEIKQGEIVCIIGPSGSGKSSLIRVINHLIEPTKGKVFFEGEEITNKNLNTIRQQIGMVFQQFELFPHLTVLDNLILAPVHLKKCTKEEAIQKAKELLNKVHLIEKLDCYPETLSGGQKQRIAIARSLMMDPKLMLFDEPTSALDPEMVKEVLQFIKDLAAFGMTIGIVTHEMSFAKEIATRILFVCEQKILVDDTPKNIFEKKEHPRLKEFLDKI